MANVSQSSRKHRQILEQFSEFTPDQPDLESEGLTFLQNTFPLATGHYGPVRGLRAESQNTLRDLADVVRVVGNVVGFRSPETGRVTGFAAATTDADSGTMRLFKYDESTRLWSDVTRSSGSYGFSASSSVRFVQHGLDVFAAVGRSDPLQVMNLDDDVRFADVPGAPKAVDVAVVREFLMAANFVLGADRFPDSVMWSSQADPRVWPTPGTADASAVNSGLAQLPGGGRLQRIIAGVGGADAVAIAEGRIWRVSFAGRPNIWQFDVAAYDQGTTVPGSVASTNESVFYYGRDGFQIFNGSSSTPLADGKIADTAINDRLLRAFTAAENGFQTAVSAAVDLDRKQYLVSYRTDRGREFEALLDSNGNTILTSDDEEILLTITEPGNNALWAFNYVSGAWGHAFLELDALGSIEANVTRLDTPRLVAMDDGMALSTFDGDILEAVFEGPEHLAKDGQTDLLMRALPGVDSNDVRVYARIRNTLGATPVKTPERQIDNDGYAALGETGVAARYWRIGMRMPEDKSWSFALGCLVELGDHGQGPVR